MANSPAVKIDWSRYEVDDNGDFVADDNGDFVEKPTPAAPKSNLRDDVTFLGSGGAGKAGSALFPRTAKAVGEGKKYPKQAGAALLDALSLPGRGVASIASAESQAAGKPSIMMSGGMGGLFPVHPNAPKGIADGNNLFAESMADTEGKNLAGKIVRDPGTAAALLTTPFTGGLSALPVYGRLAAQGAAAGLASAGAHQTENVVDNRAINPKAAIGEVALSALLPVLAKGGGDVLKAAGKGMMQNILKPSKFLRETEKINMGDVIETLGSIRPLKGSVSGMAKTAEGLESGLTSKYDDIVAANATKQIPVKASLQGTRQRLENQFVNEGKLGDVIGGIRKGADHWDDVVAQQGSKGGYPLPKAVEFRKSVGRAGRYNEGMDAREMEGPAQFARESYKTLTGTESRIVPELGPVKSALERLYPLQEAVENAQGRIGNNFFPSLTDNLALNAAAQAQSSKGMIPGLLQFLANRTLKAPQAATGSYRLGQTMTDPGGLGELRKKILERWAAQGFRDD